MDNKKAVALLEILYLRCKMLYKKKHKHACLNGGTVVSSLANISCKCDALVNICYMALVVHKEGHMSHKALPLLSSMPISLKQIWKMYTLSTPMCVYRAADWAVNDTVPQGQRSAVTPAQWRQVVSFKTSQLPVVNKLFKNPYSKKCAGTLQALLHECNVSHVW